MNLPKEFLNEIKKILGDDTGKYISLFDKPYYRGISINRLKAAPERIIPLLPFDAKKTPFCHDGYYFPSNYEGVGNLWLHHAGAYYVQEPSATSAVPLLGIERGDYVLDLCAAPGGKTAQMASLLGDSGLVWSNEIIKSRANILLSNFERMGISRGVVSSCSPEILCEKLSGYFDKVLVDAPCSGEGMFRKNPEAINEWSLEHTVSCSHRQLSILKSAAVCVREGGILVYSTCTFSEKENEEVVENFLRACPDFEPYDIDEPFGRKTRCSNAVRITPIEGGEGHFAARFKKKGNMNRIKNIFRTKNNIKKENKKLTEEFLDSIFTERPGLIYTIIGNRIYLLPEDIPPLEGTGIIRAGVFVGEIMKNRIEPAHALFTSAKPDNLRRVLRLEKNDPRIGEFLSGMEIDCDSEKGYTAVAIEGMTVGFGKCSGARLKNKYPKGLRI